MGSVVNQLSIVKPSCHTEACSGVAIFDALAGRTNGGAQPATAQPPGNIRKRQLNSGEPGPFLRPLSVTCRPSTQVACENIRPYSLSFLGPDPSTADMPSSAVKHGPRRSLLSCGREKISPEQPGSSILFSRAYAVNELYCPHHKRRTNLLPEVGAHIH
jgi:hypothetical protein